MVKAMNTDELDYIFNRLTGITDRIAQMNSIYEIDLDSAFKDLAEHSVVVQNIADQNLASDSRRAYLSHLTFHREIVADIISEARRLLMENRRVYVRQLVAYHKDFTKWLSRIERQFAA